MSKTISYRGQIAMGLEERLNLATNTGKVGYKINKFQILSSTPGATGDVEFVAKITKVKDPNIGPTVDFTNSDLLAVAYYQDDTAVNQTSTMDVIFDNEKFNQDVFVNITDAAGGTIPCNYYIELEAMPISDLEATYLTLQNVRQINSR